MNDCKYIMYEWPGKGDVPVLFPAMVKHSVINSMITHEYPGITPIAAGFVELRASGPVCYGQSTSLKLSSRGDIDSLWVGTMLPKEATC